MEAGLTGVSKADAIFNGLVNEKKVPGISVTVLKDGETLVQKGYGYSNIENKSPVDPIRTIFRIASISKNIAATALAHMVHDGDIDLDTSFYKYVPYYPQKKWDFTIRQLANHTAGIRGYQGAEYGLNKSYSIKDSIDIFKNDDLLFEPGTGYLYNSYDWVLISLAIQEVSGISFEDYVKSKVLRPLKMNTTIAPPSLDLNHEESRGQAIPNQEHDFSEQVTTFYSKNRVHGFREAIPVHNYYKLAGGGYLSTSDDIARFGQAFLDNAILNDEVLSPFLTSGVIEGKKTYYGLGWQVSEDLQGRLYYGHIGNGVGGYSNFFIYPEHEMVFSILINCTNPDVQNELDDAVSALLDIKYLS